MLHVSCCTFVLLLSWEFLKDLRGILWDSWANSDSGPFWEIFGKRENHWNVNSLAGLFTVARPQNEVGTKYFLRDTNFLTKVLRNFPRNYWAFILAGPKKISLNSRQMPRQISLPKIRKITNELLQDRRKKDCAGPGGSKSCACVLLRPIFLLGRGKHLNKIPRNPRTIAGKTLSVCFVVDCSFV